MFNSKRDKIESWSILRFIGQNAEQESPSTPVWDLSAKKAWNHCKTVPPNPNSTT